MMVSEENHAVSKIFEIVAYVNDNLDGHDQEEVSYKSEEYVSEVVVEGQEQMDYPDSSKRNWNDVVSAML